MKQEDKASTNRQSRLSWRTSSTKIKIKQKMVNIQQENKVTQRDSEDLFNFCSFLKILWKFYVKVVGHKFVFKYLFKRYLFSTGNELL